MSTTERWFGVFVGLVTDLRDPDGLGRVKVTLPWSPDSDGSRYEAWARVATLMAGKNRGSWFVPDVDDEVLVAFDGGDSRIPYVIGGLWNGKDGPPASMDGAGQNQTKLIRSRNGVKITLDDTDRYGALRDRDTRRAEADLERWAGSGDGGRCQRQLSQA